MENYESYFEANKSLWNKRTDVHKNSSFYDIEGFKAGRNVLTPIELNELGDVKGKRMLHLQCHFGMDSLNWVRLGAEVTGVDLSDEAIKEARRLSDELGLPAKFVCCNVYDLHPSNVSQNSKKDWEGAFDIVFTSYGTIGWLPDMDKWAATIAYCLRPGGIFYIAEFHPVVWMFDDEFTRVKYYYDNRELIVTENLATYTDHETVIEGKEYSWNHSLSEVMNSLMAQGLRIERFNEYTYSPYACFRNTVQGEDGNWRVRGMEGKLPMVYTIKAVKQ